MTSRYRQLPNITVRGAEVERALYPRGRGCVHVLFDFYFLGEDLRPPRSEIVARLASLGVRRAFHFGRHPETTILTTAGPMTWSLTVPKADQERVVSALTALALGEAREAEELLSEWEEAAAVNPKLRPPTESQKSHA